MFVAALLLITSVLAGDAVAGATAETEATAGLGTTLGADAQIRLVQDPDWSGDDERGIRGGRQTVVRNFRRTGGLNAYIRLQNDSATTTNMTVRGSRGNGNFSVRYFHRGREVTEAVTRGRFRSTAVDPDASTYLRVRIATRRILRKGSSHAVRITGRSGGPGSGDTVRAVLDSPRFTAAQLEAGERITATRAEVPRPELALDFGLSDRAQLWADYLAATERVQNSGLFWGLPVRWRSVAEVVGSGPTLTAAHDRLVADRGEHLKMVSDWTLMGTGVSERNGRVYLVQMFLLV